MHKSGEYMLGDAQTTVISEQCYRQICKMKSSRSPHLMVAGAAARNFISYGRNFIFREVCIEGRNRRLLGFRLDHRNTFCFVGLSTKWANSEERVTVLCALVVCFVLFILVV